MSFQEDTFKQIKKFHSPVSSNAVYLSMKDHPTLVNLSVSGGREKVRKALYSLLHERKVLTASHDLNGVLLYGLASPMTNNKDLTTIAEPVREIEPPAASQDPLRIVIKDMLLSLSSVLLETSKRL